MPLADNLTLAFSQIGADVKQLRDSTILKETNPVLTYNLDLTVSRIDYASTNYKTFSYTSGVLNQIDYIVGTATYRKTFNYNPDGTLASVVETIL